MRKILLTLLVAIAALCDVNAQWTTDYSKNNYVSPGGWADWGFESKTNADGVTYVFSQIPRNGTISMRLQVFDRAGYALTPDTGKVVSEEANITWTTFGELLMIDNDGNAIIAVADQRSGNMSYTIYKFDSKANELWHKQLCDGQTFGLVENMRMLHIDGGYLFAYDDLNDRYTIHLEKLTTDGEQVWKRDMADTKRSYSNPSIVDCGNGQTMLVYVYGSNYELRAMMLDADGNDAWDEHTDVYYGGFNIQFVIPWNLVTVKPGPDGGALVCWIFWSTDFGNYIARMSYIKNDGTYGFSTGDEGTDISSTKYSLGRPDFFYDEEEDAIFCIYNQYSEAASTTYNGLYMQKISTDGELLWGGEGKAIIPMQSEIEYGYEAVRKAGDDKLALFYMGKTFGELYKVASYMQLCDPDGEALNEPVNFTTSDARRFNLEVSDLIDGRFFMANWKVTDVVDNDVTAYMEYMQKLYIDETATSINAPSATTSSRYFNANGMEMSGPRRGLNIVRQQTADGVKTVKTMQR